MVATRYLPLNINTCHVNLVFKINKTPQAPTQNQLNSPYTNGDTPRSAMKPGKGVTSLLSQTTRKNASTPPTTSLSRAASSVSRLWPTPLTQPYNRHASTSSTGGDTGLVGWLRKARHLRVSGSDEHGGGKALLFAGLGSYPHTPHAPTASSLQIWEQASEAVLTPDATIGYWPKGMEEFAGMLGGGAIGIRGWMRGWVEGRTLDELMARMDVTNAFILTSSIAILASAQEQNLSRTLLPEGTTHLAGHGFIGTLTALVAAGRLDLPTGVRLAMLYAYLPPSPSTYSTLKPTFTTTILSVRQFHSLSSYPFDIPEHSHAESSDSPAQRRRAMQLILDEIHAMQEDLITAGEDAYEEWASAAIINSSKVLGITGTQGAVWSMIDRLQSLGLANPVMDVPMKCPHHTMLMKHAEEAARKQLSLCHFRDPPKANTPVGSIEPIILDPITTHPMKGPAATALLPQLTCQLRWHKTLSRLYLPEEPAVRSFLTVGRGAKGLGIMLRGELNRRPQGSKSITVQEFGVQHQVDQHQVMRRRATG